MICEHLKSILEYEIQRGNSIKEVSEGWSKADLVIDLEKPMDIDYELQNMINNHIVKCWENNDLHYLQQRGFFCGKCKHSLAGPRE